MAFKTRFIIFLAPLVSIFLVFEGLMWVVGENWPTRKLLSVLEKEPQWVHGVGLFSQSYHFKLAYLESRQPDIVVVGTSRALQFRREFVSGVELFNAGGCVASLTDFTALVDGFASGRFHPPSCVILVTDPWWFKETASQRASWTGDPAYEDAFFSPLAHRSAFLELLKGDRLARAEWPSVISQALQPGRRRSGVRAFQQGVGFRADGSYQYSPEIARSATKFPTYVDRETPPVIERIRTQTSYFSPSPVIPAQRLEIFWNDVERLKDLSIDLAIVLPPVARPCWEAAQIPEGMQTWWQFYWNDFPEQAALFGLPVVVCPVPQTVGMTDAAMWDGFHPGEVVAAQIFLSLLRDAHPDHSLSRISSGQIKALLDNVWNDALVFPELWMIPSPPPTTNHAL